MPQYTQKQLKEAFELVENKSHWKKPINALVSTDADIDLIHAAVIHFTATVPIFRNVSKNGNDHILVLADGYYAGPAA